MTANTTAELSATGLRIEFTTRSGRVARALDGADLVVRAGEVVALVGEWARARRRWPGAWVGLDEAGGRRDPLGGPDDEPVRPWTAAAPAQRPARAAGPGRGTEPRHTVYESVAEGLRIHRLVTGSGKTETELVAEALASAGLRPPETFFLRYPHELSGGQRQRVLIAGALAVQPQLLIADEPVSSLDASIRGEILALLLKLRKELGLGVLVVTHDLGLAWNIADRIAVMYLGRIVETGPTEEVLTSPQHPYTQALLSVIPEIERLEPIVLTGEIPDPTRIPSGCRFHPRCPALASGEADAVAEDCRARALPILSGDPEGHRCSCHLVAARASAGSPDGAGSTDEVNV